jgi:hypothetical protein
MDMRSGTWNVSSLVTVSKEVQEVRWEGSGTKLAGEYTFLYGKWSENHEFDTFFVQKRMLSEVKRVEFVSDRMSYIILGDC